MNAPETIVDPLAPETLGVATEAALEAGTAAEFLPGAIVPEPTKDVATLKPAARAVVVLKAVEAEKNLKALVERTKQITTPPVDKAGRDQIHRAAMEHKNARIAIQNAKNDATEDAKAFTKAVNAESARLIAINADEEARLFKLRDDYDTAEAARKAEEERKEKERVDAIKARIEQIAALPQQSMGDSAADLAATYDDLAAFEVTFEDFAEFQDEAKATITLALTTLAEMQSAKLRDEQAAAATRAAEAALAEQKAALEAQQAAFAEQQAAFERQKAEFEARQAATFAGPYDTVSLLTHTSLEGWREIGENPDGDIVYEAGSARAVVRDYYVVTEAQHKPASERVAEFKTIEELTPDAGLAQQAADMMDERHMGTQKDTTLLEIDVERTASLTRRDQPRQQALNEQARATVEALADIDQNMTTITGIFEPTLFDVAEEEMRRPDGVIVRADMGTQDVNVETVTITVEEYEELKGDSRLLKALYAAGVDNWEGYAAAMAEAE